MSSIFVKEKTNNITIMIEEGYCYEYISDLKIIQIIDFFENDKIILIITEEETIRQKLRITVKKDNI